MGSSSSKFRKHLQNGDEYAALHLYNSNSDLRKALDPNVSYGDNHNHDTPLHLASRHGMKSLMRIFLYEHGGNPNKKNGRDETSLQNLCMTNQGNNFVVQQRRSECLVLVLQWRGATLGDGEVEKVDLGTEDEKDNTALHYAAASGLKRCVELLVSSNAPLFTENKMKQTPCDCAEQNGQNEIALYLESKMVFSGEEENPDDLEMETILDQMESEEAYSGLRAQDLQEAKDQLLVETSDMLRVPLFTAEALLRNHEWSRESLLEAWMDNPVACCDKCGVLPPVTVCHDESSVTLTEVHRVDDHDLVTPVSPGVSHNPDEVICDICACYINPSDEPVPMTCDHVFCRVCWERYLTGKIQEGDAHNITCPGYSCSKLVPVDVIETLVSRDMARRYLQFDIKAFVDSNPTIKWCTYPGCGRAAFVDSNPSIKWCPYPGCGRAVRLPESENPLSPSFRGIMDPNMTKDFSHAVDCGNEHIFCWECMGEAHEPASCENWKKWHQKMAEIKPEELSGTEEETEMAANCLWLVTNSKPCPNCKSPIQKNEGCNHMKCSKCKHDFCWVCLEQWKRHSSSTGGYFRCNRYEVVKKVVENTDSTKSEAEARNKKMQELNRFVHYYTRFKNHEHSFKLEEPLLTTAKEKMMVLARAVTDPDTANMETKFVEDAVQQLLKGRRVLKCSYVYGFYLQETGYKKPIFEFMQTELEECTEALSEMIARPYLRTPRSKIIQTAHLVQRKRQEFVTAISKGLVPPDTSPNAKRKKGRYKLELDEDLKKALMASLSNIDPSNPWVKDPSGKHTNVSALLDWPEEEDESDNEAEVSSLSAALDDGQSSSSSEVAGGIALCSRENCCKTRAQNPRTGEVHDHCSIKCMQMDRGGVKPEKEKGEEALTDYHMDLLRALEMSRLQFLREMGQLRPGSTSSESHSPLTPRTPRSPNLSVTSTTEVQAQASISQPGPSANSTTTTATTTTTAADVTLHHDLPPMRRGRVKSEPGERLEVKGNKGGRSDVELERAMEMSRLSLHDEERDLRLAIELSLKDSLTNPKSQQKMAPPLDPSISSSDPALSPMKNQSKSDEKIHFSSRNPDYSSIVARVPNRSVEDLAQEGVNPTLENLGACGGLSSPKQRSPKFKQILDPVAPGVQKANPFGIIKDISVTNINVGDIDKTKAFEDKKLDSFLTSSSSKDNFIQQQQREFSSDDGNLPSSSKQNFGGVPTTKHSISRESAFSYSERSAAVSSFRIVGGTDSSSFQSAISTTGGDESSSSSKIVKNSSKLSNNKCSKNTEQQAGPCLYRKKDVKSVGFDEQHISSQGMKFEKNDLRSDVRKKKSDNKNFEQSQHNNLINQPQISSDHNKSNEIIIDPDDLHIDSVMLESMIQGVDEYSSPSSSNNNASVEEDTQPVETNLDNLIDQYSEPVAGGSVVPAAIPGGAAGLNREILIRTDQGNNRFNHSCGNKNSNRSNNEGNNSSLTTHDDDINDAVFV